MNISDRVQKQIDLCLNMKPEDNTHNEVDEIRKKNLINLSPNQMNPS